MTAIEASSVRVTTLADGSLRLTLDIEPRNAQAAFSLFGTPGRAVALAALVDCSGAIAEPSEPEPVAETPKKEREYLGDLCYRAVQWCGDLEFRQWLRRYGDFASELTPDNAKDVICSWCDVESRKDLDANPIAAEKFNRLIRGPYQKHLQARGLV